MSTNEENFSNKLRNKLDDQAWPMPDAAWEGAQALIDGDKRRKRAGFILFTVGLLLIMAGLVPFIWEPTTPVLAVKGEAKTVANPEGDTLKQNAPALRVEKPVLSNNAEGRNVSPAAVEPAQPVTPTLQNKVIKASPAMPKVQPAKAVAPKVAAPAVSERPSPDHTNGLERNQTPHWANAKKAVTNEMPAGTEPAQLEEKVIESHIMQEAAPLVTSPPEEKKQHDEVVAVTNEMATVLAVSPTVAPQPTVNPEPVTPPTVNEVVNTPVATTNTTTVPSEEPIKHQAPLFSLQGGIGLSPGWKADKREGAGVVPDAGVMWYARNDRKSYFGFGVHYTALTGLNTFTHTSYTTVYGLGEQSSVKKISPFTANYLMVPLRYYAYVNTKCVWGVGLNALYLLTTNSRVEEYNTVNGVAGESKKYNESGYTQGFNWYDVQAVAEVRYNLLNRWWAGAALYYGFADTKSAFLTNNSTKERAMGIRLNLIYMIPRQ